MRRVVHALLFVVMSSPHALADEPRAATDLGVPITSPNRISYATAYHFGPEQLDLLCWTTTAESGGAFCALNLASGELKVHPLHHLEAYPIVFGSDGNVYVGSTSGEVFRWDPVSDAWGPAGPPLFQWPGSRLNHVRALCEGKEGWLYAGSCYGERARINMRTGIVEKLPDTPEKGQWYVSAAAALPDGRIAFGYGYKARVFVYDPSLGRDVGQWLPESWTNDGFCFNILVGKTVLYATHFPSGRRGAFDISTGKFLDEIPWPSDSSGQQWSKWIHSSGYGSAVDFYLVPGTDGVINCDGSRIYSFDPGGTPRSTFLDPSSVLVNPSLKLALRYEVSTDCQVLEYDSLRSRVLKRFKPDLPNVERNIFALGVGPDGRVYGGAYQSTLLFQHDLKSGRTAVLGDHHPGWSGETFSYAVHGSELICASYTTGALVAYNPDSAWDCERGAMRNPRLLGFFGQQVYRPYSTCISESGSIWSVGPAGWGSVGGGLGEYDADQKRITTTAFEDVPHSVFPIPGNRLLVCSDSLVRWWDPGANRQIAATRLAFKCIDVCRLDHDSARLLMMTDSRKLLLVDAGVPGTVRITKTFTLPFPCVRVLQWEGKILVAGEGGCATLNVKNGMVNHFCHTPVVSRWACAVASGSVYFGNGGHLMSAPLPPPENGH